MKYFNLIKMSVLAFTIFSYSQSAYSDQKMFVYFNFYPGVTSVGFNHTNDTTNECSKTTVNNKTCADAEKLDGVSTGGNSTLYWIKITSAIKNGSNPISGFFNSNLGNSAGTPSNDTHMLLLGGSNAYKATDLDFWITGNLTINGESVASDFTIGHENSKFTVPYWWIGSLSAVRGPNGTGMTVHNQSESQFYCLSDSQGGIYNNDVNNQYINVLLGSCDGNQYDWSNMQSVSFEFIPESGLTVTYAYNGNNDDMHNGYQFLKSVQTSADGSGYKVTVDSKIEDDSDIASSFINKLSINTGMPNISGMLELDGTKDQPGQLDFWVEGTLKINGQAVATDFTLAHDSLSDNNWWMGSKNAVDYIISPEKTSRGMDVHTIDSNGQPQNYYCLVQNGSNNSSIVVKSGQCYSVMSSINSDTLNFVYESGIESISFVYNGNYDFTSNGDPIFNGITTGAATFNTKPYNNQSGYFVIISYYNNAGSSTDIANEFLNMFDNNVDYVFSVSTIAKLKQLKFWVQGTFLINGNSVAPDFTLAYGDKHHDNWWIASEAGETINPADNSRMRGLQFTDNYGNFYCLTNDGLADNPYNFVEVRSGKCQLLQGNYF